MKSFVYISLVALFFACVGLSWYTLDQHKTINNSKNQIKSITDTLTLYKTKDGKNGAYIRVLEGNKSEILAITEKQDKRIYDLIKETKGLRTLTTHDVVTRTDTTVRIDTLILPSDNKKLYLSKTINDEYYNAKITVDGDSLTLKHTSYNEFDYMLRDKPGTGLFKAFKPTTYIVEAINLNPNTITKNLRTIQIKTKSKNGLKIGTGIAIGIAAVLLIK